MEKDLRSRPRLRGERPALVPGSTLPVDTRLPSFSNWSMDSCLTSPLSEPGNAHAHANIGENWSINSSQHSQPWFNGAVATPDGAVAFSLLMGSGIEDAYGMSVLTCKIDRVQ